MEASILNSTKKILGLNFDYTAFDLDVITHINATFSVLNQLGVGPIDGFSIEDDGDSWTDYDVPPNQLHLIKSYMYLRVRNLFDPPQTSYLIASQEKQISEMEWRLNVFREGDLAVLLAAAEEEVA